MMLEKTTWLRRQTRRQNIELTPESGKYCNWVCAYIDNKRTQSIKCLVGHQGDSIDGQSQYNQNDY